MLAIFGRFFGFRQGARRAEAFDWEIRSPGGRGVNRFTPAVVLGLEPGWICFMLTT